VHLASGSSVRFVPGTIAAAAISGALGIGFGALVRSQTGAIVTALIWLFVGEPLLGIAGVEKYGPGHAIASVVEAGNQGSGFLGFGAGLAVALAYVVVAGALGTDALKRADIT
jgi:hypothetical protein